MLGLLALSGGLTAGIEPLDLLQRQSGTKGEI